MRQYAILNIIAIIFSTVAITMSWNNFTQGKTSLIVAILFTVINAIMLVLNAIVIIRDISENQKDGGNKNE